MIWRRAGKFPALFFIFGLEDIFFGTVSKLREQPVIIV